MKISITMMAFLAALTTGCGSKPTAQVSGSVTLNDKPLAQAEVRFVPTDNVNLGMLVATTDIEGKFTITHDAADHPAQPGKYNVIISKTKEVAAADGGMPNVVNELPEYAREQEFHAELQPGPNTLEPFSFSKTHKATH